LGLLIGKHKAAAEYTGGLPVPERLKSLAPQVQHAAKSSKKQRRVSAPLLCFAPN